MHQFDAPDPPNGTTTTYSPEALAVATHKQDSLALQLLIFLLMLTLLMVWRFKFRKYFFLHETGVSLVLGL